MLVLDKFLKAHDSGIGGTDDCDDEVKHHYEHK